MSSIIIICALLNIWLAGKILLLSPRSSLHRSFALLSFSLGGWMASVFVSSINPVNSAVITETSKFCFSFAAMIPLAILLFSRAIYTNNKPFSTPAYIISALTLLFWTWASFARLLVKTGYSFLPYKADYGFLFGPFNLYFFVLFFAGMFFLLRSVKKDIAMRSKVLKLFSGLFIMIFLASASALLFPLWGIDAFFGFSYLIPFFVVVVILYTVFYENILDIRLFLRETTYYAFIFSVVAGLLGGTLLLISRPFFTSVTNIVIFVIINSFITTLLKDKITALVDGFLHKDRLAFREALMTLNDEIIQVLSLQDLTHKLPALVNTLFKPKQTYVYIKDLLTRDMLLEVTTKAALPTASVDVMRREKVIFRDDPRMPAVFADKNCDLLIALVINNELIGLLGLIVNPGYLNYTRENIDLIRIFANQVSIALSNAIKNEENLQKQTQLFQAEKLAAIGQTVSGLVHELKNPLTGIKLSLGNVKNYLSTRNVLDQDTAQLLTQAGENIEGLHRHLKEFLDFSRKEDLHCLPVDLNMIVQKARYFVSEQLDQKKIRFIFQETPGMTLSCDPQKIQQVLLNLFLNAIHAMDTGGSLTVSMEKQGKMIALRVEDTGQGIPEKDLNQIFDPFYTTKTEGTGMGLAVSKEIIELHKGSITVESTIGVGTTFTLSLPLAGC